MNKIELKRLALNILILCVSSICLYAQVNDDYINTELKTLDKLVKKGDFAKGTIYTIEDTFETRLLSFKGKHKMNYFLFCVIKDKSDEIQIIKPQQIIGYSTGNEDYITQVSNNEYFFLRKLDSGKIELYQRSPIPSDMKLLYYLKFYNLNEYMTICPNEKNISVNRLPDNSKPADSGATIEYFQSKGIDKKFNMFVSIYLGDCPKVKNMVDSGFYTINNIPSIVRTYNSCFDD